MNFFNAKSVEELKKYGKLVDLRQDISNLLGNEIKIKSNTWHNIFKSIVALKKVAHYISGGSNTVVDSNDLYFKGNAERYIFILLEMDGKQRLDKLGVNRSHVSKKGIADKWRNEIAKIIHPDVCSHPLAEKAMAELTEIYKGMIK